MRNLSSSERGILANVDIGMAENGQMVVNDDRIVDAPEGESPYSALHRAPPSAVPPDIVAMMEQHILSASHPGETIEEYTRFLRELAAKNVSPGPTQMSLNRGGFNSAGCWSGAPGKAFGRDVVRCSLGGQVNRGNELGRFEKYLREVTGAGSGSRDDVADVLQGIADKIDDEMLEFDSPVQREAVGLLKTIIGTVTLQRKLKSHKAAEEDRTEDRTVGDDFASAYSEASPAFASMGLRQPQRQQTDAEAERLVDQLFHRKRFQATAG